MSRPNFVSVFRFICIVMIVVAASAIWARNVWPLVLIGGCGFWLLAVIEECSERIIAVIREGRQ